MLNGSVGGRAAAALVLLAVGLLVAACSGPDSGLPTATAGTGSAAATSPASPTTVAVAPLNRPITLAQLAPALTLPAATPVQAAAPDAAATPTATPAPTATAGPAPTPTLPPGGQTDLVPILMYHYVRPDPGKNDPVGEDLSVSPGNFQAQMAWLARNGYHTMTVGELNRVRRHEIGLPTKPIALTFDDGYRDFYTAAYPVLKQYGFKATLFVITGFLGQPQYVTWDMVTEMDRSGLIEMGAHTVTHRDLPSLSAAAARNEIFDSKQTLETRLGHPVVSFNYPSGRYDDAVVALVKQAGYQIAVTTQGGWARATENALLLPRVRVHGAVTLAAFAGMLQ